MEDGNIPELILKKFFESMTLDPLLKENISKEIINSIKEGKCKKTIQKKFVKRLLGDML